MLDTGEKYCKRYTLSELKKVKIRNSKFELLVVKFISLHDFSSYIFERGIFWYLGRVFQHWGNWGNYCSVSFHFAGSKLTHWFCRSVSMKIPLFGHFICVNYLLGKSFGHLWIVRYYLRITRVMRVTHSKKFCIPFDV